MNVTMSKADQEKLRALNAKWDLARSRGENPLEDEPEEEEYKATVDPWGMFF